MLTLAGITKTYPGVRALDNVSLTVNDGEVHALLGENGAGKSTLIKIIAGAIPPDAGSVCFDGRSYACMTPQTAQAEGVAVIYQELNLCGPLSVAENMFLGRPQAKFYSQRLVNGMAQKIFDESCAGFPAALPLPASNTARAGKRAFPPWFTMRRRPFAVCGRTPRNTGWTGTASTVGARHPAGGSCPCSA